MNVILRLIRCTAPAAILAAVLAAPIHAQTKPVLLSVELPDSPAAGARLFAQKSCVRCHSLGGGEARVGPDLGRILFSGTVLDLAGAFWNHAPVMREKMQDLRIQPPTMTSGEMADIIAILTAYRYYITELGGPGNPTTGREVFVNKGCDNCHSVNGNAWEQLGPNLRRYRGRFSAIFLAQAMWNHGPEMASAMRGAGVAWPKFTGREMGDLVAYLQAGNGGSSEERVYFEPGSPRRGRELFAEKRCISCHAIAGKGGQGGPDLGTRPRELVGSVASIAGLMWNHSQGMTAEFKRRGIPRVMFSGQEMADIIGYLYFVNYANVRGTPARGAQIFVEKCSTCHSVGAGKRVGPDLGGVPQLDDPIAIIAAMWNHSSKMEQELRKRALPWPRLESGEAADLTAFLLSRR
ncbi:MAG: c-type cytochrome, partial [Acidobacteria bacterium]|nr:c-type cytochrome [Acidobacteriota bacterium]